MRLGEGVGRRDHPQRLLDLGARSPTSPDALRSAGEAGEQRDRPLEQGAEGRGEVEARGGRVARTGLAVLSSDRLRTRALARDRPGRGARTCFPCGDRARSRGGDARLNRRRSRSGQSGAAPRRTQVALRRSRWEAGTGRCVPGRPRREDALRHRRQRQVREARSRVGGDRSRGRRNQHLPLPSRLRRWPWRCQPSAVLIADPVEQHTGAASPFRTALLATRRVSGLNTGRREFTLRAPPTAWQRHGHRRSVDGSGKVLVATTNGLSSPPTLERASRT